MAEKNTKIINNDTNLEHEFLQSIFEYSLDAYFLLDFEGKFIMGNLDRGNILNKKAADFIGKDIMQSGIIKDNYLPRALAMMSKVKTGLVVGPENLIINGLLGERIIEVVVRPISIIDGKYIFGVARDMTDIKKREQDLNDKIDELENVNKIMVDRELKMVELKAKLEEMRQKYEKAN
ncbi:MAG: PAS domain S-box protein [Candidatus Falkowbacteria bacterium]